MEERSTPILLEEEEFIHTSEKLEEDVDVSTRTKARAPEGELDDVYWCGPVDAFPSQCLTHCWLIAKSDGYAYPNDNGKWLMFFDRTVIDEKWKEASAQYFRGDLSGISCVKVSTAMPNPRFPNSDQHVLAFVCGPAENESLVMDIGAKLIAVFPPDCESIYYKSDEQSRRSLEKENEAKQENGTQKKRNSMYRLRVKLSPRKSAVGNGAKQDKRFASKDVESSPVSGQEETAEGSAQRGKSKPSFPSADTKISEVSDDEVTEFPKDGLVMVLDTETTGFPPKAPPSDFKAWEYCRMLEIAWHLYSARGKLISKHEYLIKPDFDFAIPEGAIKVHGITREKAETEGRALQEVLDRFYSSLDGVSAVVGHNVQFDVRVILAEICRGNSDELFKKFRRIPKICTMMMGARVMPNGKRAKLSVLYEECFGEAPTGILHRADFDVEVCARVYFCLREKEDSEVESEAESAESEPDGGIILGQNIPEPQTTDKDEVDEVAEMLQEVALQGPGNSSGSQPVIVNVEFWLRALWVAAFVALVGYISSWFFL